MPNTADQSNKRKLYMRKYMKKYYKDNPEQAEKNRVRAKERGRRKYHEYLEELKKQVY